jgi:hypothetical protein
MDIVQLLPVLLSIDFGIKVMCVMLAIIAAAILIKK